MVRFEDRWKEKDYSTVAMLFGIVCVLFDRLTGYTKYPKRTIVYEIYRSLMSRVASGNWKRG